ncbi:MAG: class I SAM-dependent methyltransferase [Woeseiaceae bacterium]
MRQIYYWAAADRLVYIDEQATPEFWDAYWQSAGPPPPLHPKHHVRVVTSRFLARGARVLEGGCGRGDKVNAMAEEGFSSVGVDFGRNTVGHAREHFPGIDIREGDVRALDFPDETFDGYWSIGVIEHFWDGYEDILQEAVRVLKPGAFLFLTAPWFSPYRHRLARKEHIPSADYAAAPENFYQFALSRREIRRMLHKHGFELQLWRGVAPEICMREGGATFAKLADWLYGTRGSLVKRGMRFLMTPFLSRYCGHSFLAVAQRRARLSTPASEDADRG